MGAPSEVNFEEMAETKAKPEIRKYRKKPAEIVALRYDGENAEDIQKFVGPTECVLWDGEVYVDTMEGRMHVSAGDYVIKGVQGEFYPCKENIFNETYEEV